jgi:tetratricopeptide (TPR) repeat protein
MHPTMTNSTARYWDRAQRYLADRQLTAARIALESLLQRDSSHVPSLLTLVGIALAEDRMRDATAHALAAAQHIPDDPMLIGDITEALLRVGETVAARNCLDHPSLTHVSEGVALARLAKLRETLGDHEEALALLNRADAAGLNVPDFRFDRAMELIYNGYLLEGEQQLEACLRMAPTHGQAALALARQRKQTTQQNHLLDLKQRLRDVKQNSEDHAVLEFALYKELEDLGNYDEAWDTLARANALMFARQRHDPGLAWRLFESLIERCTPQMLQPDDVVHEGPQPIFIIGMPRSGTTLLERVLSNHSQVTSAGELNEFGLQLRWAADHRLTLDEYIVQRLPDLDYTELGRRYLERTQWRAEGKRYYIDKLPRNWMAAGMIRRALPQARILNMVREPMDVCFSNYRTLVMGDAFPWCYDLQALAAHYLQYRRVMTHWHAVMPGQILDVSYSELVHDPEAVARKVLAYCNLEWEPDCVDVTRNKAVVATLSTTQVRESIHTRFIDEWRRYESQLEPLRKALFA